MATIMVCDRCQQNDGEHPALRIRQYTIKPTDNQHSKIWYADLCNECAEFVMGEMNPRHPDAVRAELERLRQQEAKLKGS